MRKTLIPLQTGVLLFTLISGLDQEKGHGT